MHLAHYKQRLYSILVLFFFIFQIKAQVEFDFENGSLEGWFGDTELFTINSENRLQLDAEEAGEAYIYTEATFVDSMLWEIDINLNFAPSGSNKLELWLASDDSNLTSNNGYLLSIGATGANDALEIYYVDEGVKEFISAGDMGSVASNFDLSLSITKSEDHQWNIVSTHSNDQSKNEVLNFSFVDDSFGSYQFFGLKCIYTSTRTKAFSFDNILIDRIRPDLKGPKILNYSIENPDLIKVEFDEPIESSSAQDQNNYTFEPSIGIQEIRLSQENPTLACILLAESLPSGITTQLTIKNIEDLNGNTLVDTSFTLILKEDPVPGDLVINELLYDPPSEFDVDFIELKNCSDKVLCLDKVYLDRAEANVNEVKLKDGLQLMPGEVIAITQDAQATRDNFNPPIDANIVEQAMINYVNDEGNAWLKVSHNMGFTTLDSFNYSNDFHAPILTEDQKEGISLERLDCSATDEPSENWYSAASGSNYGTPGFENSQGLNPIEVTTNFELVNKVFSPDGDGFEDLLIMQYSVDKPGYLVNIVIFDDTGRAKWTRNANQIVGLEGFLRWDGRQDDGTFAPIGMYVIKYQFFHPEGDRIQGKAVCVLAQNLD